MYVLHVTATTSSTLRVTAVILIQSIFNVSAEKDFHLTGISEKVRNTVHFTGTSTEAWYYEVSNTSKRVMVMLLTSCGLVMEIRNLDDGVACFHPPERCGLTKARTRPRENLGKPLGCSDRPGNHDPSLAERPRNRK